MVTRASSASNTALITRQVLHPRECCAAGMDLSGEGGSAVRIGDANVTHFCPWLKSSQKSRLARTACRHSGGYSDQVAEKPRVNGHFTLQPFVGPTYWRNAKSCD